jgi:photosystem II stability/assembly factor-like uncharacterized protein
MRFEGSAALALLSLLAAAPGAWARTVDRPPVLAAPVQRFSPPVVGAVLDSMPGGRSYALAADRADGLEMPRAYWWTRAAGSGRWTLLNGQPSSYSPWTLAPDPVQPDTVYAADTAGAVSRSLDAGATWEERGSAPAGHTVRLLVAGPDLLLMGDVSCFPCRSSDGGLTWSEEDTVSDPLVVAPADPRVVYAFDDQGIFRSADGARSFADVSPAVGEGARGLAVAPSDANVVYALADTPAGFLRRTTDGGATWLQLTPPASRLTWSGPAVDPLAPQHVVVLGGPRDGAAPRRLFESFDGGASWTPRAGPVGALALRFAAGPAIEAFGERGLFTSADHGDHWAPADSGLTADGDLLLAGTGDGTLYVASLPAGAVWRSTDAGRSWEPHGLRSWIVSLAVDPFDPTQLVALEETGLGIDWSDDGGKTWTVRPVPAARQGPIFTYSLTFDPHRRNAVYAGTDADAWRSMDRGVTWSRLTASLPAGIDCNHSGCFNIRDVESIVPDPLVPSRLYAVAHAYGIYRTEDGGATWRFLRPPSPFFLDSPLLRPDPRIADRLYAGAVGSDTYVYESPAAGAPPWRVDLRTPGFAPGGTIWLTFDPRGRLFVAPQANVATFLRRLGGTAWERLPVALPYAYREEVELLDPLVPAPGGGTRLFLLVPGLGLVRADLPEPP